MKLELEHLAPYLPYGLNGLQESNGLIWWMYKESNICRQEDNYHSISINDFFIYELKPILRPLSDLDIGILQEFNFLYAPNISDDVNLYSYEFMTYCFKNHVDVFGLIDKGWAININTL